MAQEQVAIPVATVTGFILRCLSLDRVRCRHLPCRERVEIGKPILDIVGIGFLINRYVSHGDKLLRSPLRSQGIEPNLEAYLRRQRLEVGQILIIRTHVALITALV